MTLYYKTVVLRAGATPGTFDGAGQIVLNDKASKVVGVGLSMSQSIHTTDEGVGMAIQVTSSQIPTGKAIFPIGWFSNSGPATNNSAKISPVDLLAVDWPVQPNTTFDFDITSLGGTQTGTLDVKIFLVYMGDNVPSDIVNRIGIGVVPFGGGELSRDDAVAVTAETPMPTFKIPETAKELIAVKAVVFLDSAVTASQEIGGHVRLDLGLSDQTPLEIPLNGGDPGLGTEVEGSDLTVIPWLPMHVPLPPREITCSPHVNLMSAITGGAQVILALAWRY